MAKSRFFLFHGNSWKYADICRLLPGELRRSAAGDAAPILSGLDQRERAPHGVRESRLKFVFSKLLVHPVDAKMLRFFRLGQKPALSLLLYPLALAFVCPGSA
jgi:hypothetical protein